MRRDLEAVIRAAQAADYHRFARRRDVGSGGSKGAARLIARATGTRCTSCNCLSYAVRLGTAGGFRAASALRSWKLGVTFAVAIVVAEIATKVLIASLT